MKKWILFCLFLCSAAFANTLSLKDQLATAEPGTFVVTEQNKVFTFLHVNAKKGKSIVLEEVSIPAGLITQKPMPWQAWFERGAPGHTSWIMTQINLENGKFEEMFSFTHQGWVDMSDSNSFLTKLLNLPFYQVPEKERRKIGLPPGYNSPDRRPLWHPRVVFEGRMLQGIPSTAWKARWPCDGSDLSRKWIEIYLPNRVADTLSALLPSYFPYWIEVEGKIGSAKVRVVDSGRGVLSPKGALPVRPPRVIGQNYTPEGLEIYLKTSLSTQEFDLLAEDMDAFGKFFPLPCKTTQLEDKISLFIPMSELAQEMHAGNSYRFIISEKDNPSICIETINPFVFYKHN